MVHCVFRVCCSVCSAVWPRACHVCACVCVCMCLSVNERERESEREGGRERERHENEIVRACCSVLQFEPKPHVCVL